METIWIVVLVLVVVVLAFLIKEVITELGSTYKR